MSNMIELGGFTIVFVLIVVLTTLFFCYGLMKICLIAVRKDRQARLREEQRLEEGYAVPVEPIRVILARDEEAAGLDDEVSKVTPPAYGIWRESVVSLGMKGGGPGGGPVLHRVPKANTTVSELIPIFYTGSEANPRGIPTESTGRERAIAIGHHHTSPTTACRMWSTPNRGPSRHLPSIRSSQCTRPKLAG